jgi:hypothetical protein
MKQDDNGTYVMSDKKLIERLERLQRIAENLPATDSPDKDELVQGLSNLSAELRDVQRSDTPTCGHCGSVFTYERSDGDTACYDCEGIMPYEGETR